MDKNVALDLARCLGLSQRKVALIGSLNDQQLAAYIAYYTLYSFAGATCPLELSMFPTIRQNN